MYQDNKLITHHVISLLNCLGKIVEMAAAMMVSTHCGATGAFHAGQCGCRARRSAAVLVGVTIAQTQGMELGSHHRGPPYRHRRRLPQRGQGPPLQKMRSMGRDEKRSRRWTASCAIAESSSASMPRWRANGRDNRPPAGLPQLSSPLRRLHRGNSWGSVGPGRG